MSIHTISLGGAFAFPGTARRSPAAAPSARQYPVSILGVPFDAVTASDALARIDEMVAVRRPHYVVTPNVDFLVQARRDAELHRILCEADLVLCDGQPLVWASRWLGNPLPERVAGADLAPRLIAQAARRGHRLFLLGATPEANAAATARLQAEYPGLPLAGSYAPPFRPLEQMDHADIVARVTAARPDILFVSFGCPKQEKWIARHYRALGVPVCLGVGATIDFLAGQVRRAPVWMRRCGLEWTYRLGQEPRRLYRRYATDLRCFGLAFAAQWWRLRRGATAGRTGGGLDRDAVQQMPELWRRIEAADGDCEVDLSGVDYIDSTGAAALAVWRRVLRRKGHRLRLVGPPDRVQRLLQPTGLGDVLMGETGAEGAR